MLAAVTLNKYRRIFSDNNRETGIKNKGEEGWTTGFSTTFNWEEINFPALPQHLIPALYKMCVAQLSIWEKINFHIIRGIYEAKIYCHLWATAVSPRWSDKSKEECCARGQEKQLELLVLALVQWKLPPSVSQNWIGLKRIKYTLYKLTFV